MDVNSELEGRSEKSSQKIVGIEVEYKMEKLGDIKE